MDKVILYFGYVMFFAICGYLLFIVLSYFFILLGESLKKMKYKKKGQNNNCNQENKSPKDIISLKVFIVNAYEGLYRVFVFKTGKIPLNWLRKLIYKHIFKMNIAKKVVLHKGLEIRGGIKLLSGKVQ